MLLYGHQKIWDHNELKAYSFITVGDRKRDCVKLSVTKLALHQTTQSNFLLYTSWNRLK